MYPHGYPHFSAQEVAQLEKTANFRIVLFRSQDILKIGCFGPSKWSFTGAKSGGITEALLRAIPLKIALAIEQQ